jgi:hypothetical protein
MKNRPPEPTPHLTPSLRAQALLVVRLQSLLRDQDVMALRQTCRQMRELLPRPRGIFRLQHEATAESEVAEEACPVCGRKSDRTRAHLVMIDWRTEGYRLPCKGRCSAILARRSIVNGLRALEFFLSLGYGSQEIIRRVVRTGTKSLTRGYLRAPWNGKSVERTVRKCVLMACDD